MLYELYRTLEHKVTFTVQLIPRTFSGTPLPLRSIYGGVAPRRSPPLHPCMTLKTVYFTAVYYYVPYGAADGDLVELNGAVRTAGDGVGAPRQLTADPVITVAVAKRTTVKKLSSSLSSSSSAHL